MADGKMLLRVRELPDKIEEAKKLRDELESLIETADILTNKRLLASIRRSEEDLKKGRFTRVKSERELDEFFKG